MSETKRIKTALVSVYHKEGLNEIINKLHEEGVQFLSTGGTRQFIESLGYPCQAVEDLTSYPSILGGRVKTLHPKVFGGILCRRSLEQDRQQMEKYGIPEIDLVIVDLYPFEATVASGASEAEIIEKIDIGGISLIRAGAKNYNDVVIVASQAQYGPFRDMLMEHGATTTLEERRWLAKEAFAVSSHYDSAIFNYFDGGEGSAFRLAAEHPTPLAQGENPHQKACYYGQLDQMIDQIHGREPDANILTEVDAAVSLTDEWGSEPTCALVARRITRAAATRPTLLQAWTDAMATYTAYTQGCIVATNAVVDKETAEGIAEANPDAIVAPDYDVDALEILSRRADRIILVRKPARRNKGEFRSLLNGVLAQERDTAAETAADLRIVTQQQPDDTQLADLAWANTLVKHAPSDAVALVRHKQLLALAAGQPSAYEALYQAIAKAQAAGLDLQGAVIASDASLADDAPSILPLAATQQGISALVQPDTATTAATAKVCDDSHMVLAVTTLRHLKY